MADLRSEFPVCDRLAYLNAGTNGPVARRSVEAAREALDRQAEAGRGGGPAFDELLACCESLRERAARLLGCSPDETALTGSTTDGVNTVLASFDLRPGDEVLTSDEEHPGVLAPLAVARERRGARVRAVPFAELASEVRPETRLVACSHVSWTTGRVADTEGLAAAGAPVLLDGAQGIGAVPVDVGALGCDFYAASGQKWLCGPNGLGYLYVRRERAEEMLPAWPGYGSLEDAGRPLDLVLRPAARRLDTGLPGLHQAAWALAALDGLEGEGIAEVHERAATLAASLADRLAERGRTVAPRGRTTLVSWEADDPEGVNERLLAEGVVVRHLPGLPYVRASVGAWTSEEDLDRLLALAA